MGTGLDWEGRYTSNHHPRESETFKLTNPAAIGDDFHNPLQVKVLKSPDGGTQDDAKGTVRERMHGSIYASKNDAKGIEEKGSEINTVARR
jgi:hypothetical protein